MQLSLHSAFLQVLQAAEVEHDVSGLAKVYLNDKGMRVVKTSDYQTQITRTSCNRLRILISMSSIILPMFVTCDVYSCRGWSCSV